MNSQYRVNKPSRAKGQKSKNQTLDIRLHPEPRYSRNVRTATENKNKNQFFIVRGYKSLTLRFIYITILF
jgi:hypothetical protein